jgi:hypothetical protein
LLGRGLSGGFLFAQLVGAQLKIQSPFAVVLLQYIDCLQQPCESLLVENWFVSSVGHDFFRHLQTPSDVCGQATGRGMELF